MKKTITLSLAIAATISSSYGAIIQSIAGPNTATGGGVGNVLIDETTDTGDWITNLSAGGTMYIGFNWTVNDNDLETGTGGFFGGLGFFNGTTAAGERALVGNDWISLNFAIARPGNESSSSIPYIIGTSARLVVKLTVTDGGTDDDTLELFVNQNTEGTPDASASYTLDDFTQITHRAGNGFGEATLVNLIVADDFASAAAVVPEPSSSALLGLAGCALILRRRK